MSNFHYQYYKKDIDIFNRKTNTKSWYTKISLIHYLLSYKRLKFALDEARRRKNEHGAPHRGATV